MMHFLSVPLLDDYLKELKDQPTQSDENVLSDRLNVLSQAATGILCMGDNSYMSILNHSIPVLQ